MIQNGNTVCETMSTTLGQRETETETGQRETETGVCRGMTEEERQAALEQTRLALHLQG